MRTLGSIALLFSALATAQPNYTGWVDSASCNGITGWAADLARPDAAILVSMWDGPTMIASTVARSPRPDVGAVIKDKGLHGFSLSVPADGAKRVLQLHFETSTSFLGAPNVLQCGVPVIPPVVVIPLTPGLPIMRETPSGAVDGKNKNFTMSLVANELFPVLVFRNRQLLELAAYKVAGTSGPGSGIIFVQAPAIGDTIEVIYWNQWQAKTP